MCWGEEPLDIVMTVLKWLVKCRPEHVRFFFYLLRMLCGLVLDFACAIVVYNEIIKEQFPDDISDSIWPYLGYVLFQSIAWSILFVQCFRVAKGNMGMPTFFQTYKGIDFILGLINAAGFIVGRDQINFKDWKQMIALGLTACDVVVDPIQLVISCCWSRIE